MREIVVWRSVAFSREMITAELRPVIGMMADEPAGATA